jgi:DNA-binding NarL/FixJ family response regulator
MSKTIRAAIVEADPYARQWMEMVIARDWRTKVVLTARSHPELSQALKGGETVHVALVNDRLSDWGELQEQAEMQRQRQPELKVVTISSQPTLILLEMFNRAYGPTWQGYLAKDEVMNALGWALAFAMEGKWVMTPTVSSLFAHSLVKIPNRRVVLDGRRPFGGLTPAEAALARAALLFSMERREVADELDLSLNWTYTAIHHLYEKIGVNDLIRGEVDPSAYLGNHPVLLARYQEILAAGARSKKGIDKETLAFHMLNTPEILEDTG